MKDFRMSRKEADQIIIFNSIVKGQISQKEAADILGLSTRQVRRKLKRYIAEGAYGLTHKGRGKASNRKLSEERRLEIVKFLKTVYSVYGPTLAAEKLAEINRIYLDHETLRRLMIEEGLWQVHRRKYKSHVWRERKHCFGELVQIDGSYHKWFNDQYSTLLAFIDDATGIIELLFADHETTESLVQITQWYLSKYGRPRALYSDCGRVYKVNNGKQAKKGDTQYARMLKELDIELIHAYSPQAKGRVENLFKTLQDRLVKDLALRQITTMEDANAFLKRIYIQQHNKRFSKPPKNVLDLHRPIAELQLNTIFCIKEERILNNDRTICYKNRLFLLPKEQPVKLYKKCTIQVYTNFDGTVALYMHGKALDYKEITEIPSRTKTHEPRIVENKAGYTPPKNHPWRNPGQNWDTFKESKRGHS